MSGPVDGAPPPSLGGPVERRRHSLFHRHHDDDAPAAWCPRCGGEFHAGATWCDDCGVPLTSEAPPVPEVEVEVEPVRSDRHDVVEYDLSEWTDEQRTALVEQLELEHIVHEWQGAHLKVPGAHEANVDELVDLFDAAGAEAPPDDVEYVFEEWTPQQCQQLVERLLELGIACVWDGYLLSIGAADEPTVDAEVLRIDPTFPVTDDGEGEELPPDEPPKAGLGGVVLEVAMGFLGLDPDP